MNTLYRVLADARFSLRLLRRSPVFGLTLIGVLVAGIGATTAMFSLVMALLVRPLPFAHPEELTVLWESQPMIGATPVDLLDFNDWKARNTTFASMAVVEDNGFSIAGDGDVATSLAGATVSGEFFEMLGAHALRGRMLGPDDDRLGAPQVCVISARLWHDRFGSDPAMVGRTVTLDSRPWTVVGIAEESFAFAMPREGKVEVWAPLAAARKDYAKLLEPPFRGSHFLTAMGRRKPGVSLESAQTEMTSIAKSLATTYPETNTGIGVTLVDLRDDVVGPAKASVWLLFGAVAIVFFVMCANVANLLLARAATRRGEMAARAALGATPGRLAAQLVTETATIFLVAALGGAGVAHWLVGFFGRAVVTANGIAATNVAVDSWALAFAIVVALVCGIVFGLIPAVEAMRVSPQAVLKEASTRSVARGGQKALRGGLVVVQVALAFALLASSGSALRAFQRVANAPLGYAPEDVATFSLWLPVTKYDDARAIALWKALQQRLTAEPGVTSVSGSSSIPLGHSNSNSSFEIEGRPPWPAGSRPTIERQEILPGYFRTMGTTLLRGRDVTDADVGEGRPVIVINRRAAEKFFPSGEAIGHRLDVEGGDDNKHNWREIVGVVDDMSHTDFKSPVVPESYSPAIQNAPLHLFFVVRGGRTEALLHDVSRIVASLDPELAVSSRLAMTARVEESVASQRFAAVLLGAFAVAGLLLATLGIFGLVTYTTNQRTRELGIRLALGSPPSGILAVVMKESMRLLALGLGIGVVAALLLGQSLAERVRSAVAFEPLVLGIILVVLGFFGTLASLLPALRAIRIPPAVALRYE